MEIISAMSADKKRTKTGIKFVMIDKIGSSFINPIKYEDINKTFGIDWRGKYEYSKNSKVNI